FRGGFAAFKFLEAALRAQMSECNQRALRYPLRMARVIILGIFYGIDECCRRALRTKFLDGLNGFKPYDEGRIRQKGKHLGRRTDVSERRQGAERSVSDHPRRVFQKRADQWSRRGASDFRDTHYSDIAIGVRVRGIFCDLQKRGNSLGAVAFLP